MSGPGYDELMVLKNKIEELLTRYSSLRIELQESRSVNEGLKAILQEREEKIKELEIKYERVKLSGALLGEGENAGEAKRKLDQLVREIDKCVALLNR